MEEKERTIGGKVAMIRGVLPPKPTTPVKAIDAEKQKQEVITRLEKIDSGEIKGRVITRHGRELLREHRMEQAQAGKYPDSAASVIIAAQKARDRKKAQRLARAK